MNLRPLTLLALILPMAMLAPRTPARNLGLGILAKPPLAVVPDDDAEWIRKKQTVQTPSQTLSYTSTCGLMPLRNSNGEVEGHIFFTAYTMPAAPGKKRPVTFVFNGGPGSASIWLHLGFVGPKRVNMLPDGMMPAPPYNLVPNESSLLPETDIVCIDPVGTGLSRPAKPEYGSKFWGLHEDIASVGEFIRMYLTLEQRWLSPHFVLGESYGGIRGAGLAQWLGDNGIGLNGLIMVSPYLNGSVQDDAKANDQPFAFNLPSYAAAAWFHKKLSPELEAKPVGEVFTEVQNWVYDTYLPDLLRGDQLSPQKKEAMVSRLHRYTGLSPTFLKDTNYRIRPWNWFKELLRQDRHTVGRYDARFVGIDRLWNGESPDYDPSDSSINAPFISCMNDYLRGELGYKTSVKYAAGGEGINHWKFDEGQVVDTSEALRSALAQNPYTKVFVAMGYYDLACPMGTVEQILHQMEIDPRLKSNVTEGHYAAGHMMYLDSDCRKQLHHDLAAFILRASTPEAPADTLRPKARG